MREEELNQYMNLLDLYGCYLVLDAVHCYKRFLGIKSEKNGLAEKINHLKDKIELYRIKWNQDEAEDLGDCSLLEDLDVVIKNLDTLRINKKRIPIMNLELGLKKVKRGESYQTTCK